MTNDSRWMDALLERQSALMFPLRKKLRFGLLVIGLASIPVAEGAQNACDKAAGEAIYSAVFKWKAPSAAQDDMRIVVTKAAKPGFTDSKIMARVMKGNACQAVCSAKKLETVRMGKAVQASALELSCKSADFAALSSPATVYLRNEVTGNRQAVIRFGTWLQGYEQASLTTQLDHSARLVAEMAPQSKAPAETLALK